MTLYGESASIYDRLYATKDYLSECDAIEALLARHAFRDVQQILELGCGTGGHLIPLTYRGYTMTGVDIAPAMLERATAKLDHAGLSATLVEADMRALALDERYDAAIAMFSVISYLTTMEELDAAFQAVHDHLEPDGLFLFDVWYGPGVLNDPPSDRVRLVETENGGFLLRIAKPDHQPLDQTVEVHYRYMQIEGDRVQNRLEERHLMRYFFPQELVVLLEAAGFTLCSMTRLNMAGTPLDDQDWQACIVARKGATGAKRIEKAKSVKDKET